MTIDYNFFNFDSKILLNLLSKRIVCFKFVVLLKKLLKTNYKIPWKFVSLNKNYYLIFNNIYLHELDLFIRKLSEFFNQNRCYKKFLAFRNVRFQKKKKNADVLVSLKLPKRCKIYNNNFFIFNFKKFYYIRCGKSFVIGVEGSRKDIFKISYTIEIFMRNELQFPLNPQTISVIHFNKNPLFFLGFFIRKNWCRNKYLQITKKKNRISMKTKMMSKIILKASIKLIFEKATLHGFFKNRVNKFIPIRIARCINLNHRNILRYYNFVIYGIFNYYFFIINKKSFFSFINGLKLSCARTLALKYKLCYASKIYKKFGVKLRLFNQNIELFIPPVFKKIKKPRYKVVVLDNL